LELEDQPPHSVRLIKIVNAAIPAEPPALMVDAPSSAEVDKLVKASVSCDPGGVPALSYKWEFGDGTSADGPEATHTYTRAGAYSIKVSAEGVDGLIAIKTISITLTGSVDTQFHLSKNQRYTDPSRP
jgi:hypothetical protein